MGFFGFVGIVGILRGIREGVHCCLGELRCGKLIGPSGGIWVSSMILLTSNYFLVVVAFVVVVGSRVVLVAGVLLAVSSQPV